MATIDGVYNGSDMFLYLGTEILVHSTNTSFSLEQKLKNTTCRETQGWNQSIAGMREWGMDAEGAVAFRNSSGTLYANEPNYIGVADIINDYIINRNKVFVKVKPPGASSVNNDNLKWEGYVYITSVNIDTPNEDTSTFSLSLSGVNEFNITIMSIV